VLGPAPAPVLKIRNLYRYHLRLLAPSAKPLQDVLHASPAKVPVPNGVELVIDVDPVNLL
jgi:primosomal protein N' (replication factor Y)